MLALPTLESFGARNDDKVFGHPNNRLAYIYFPNGTATGSWEPRKVARDGKILQLNLARSGMDKTFINFIKRLSPLGNGTKSYLK